METYKILIFALTFDDESKKIPVEKIIINDAILSFVNRVIEQIKIFFINSITILGIQTLLYAQN